MAAKRIKLFYSKFQSNECTKRNHIDNDRISWLPDDILISIISFLPLDEAARTSVLSTRWINLWEHTSRLNFNAESALKRIYMQYKLRNEERLKYKKWVNRVLRSNKSPTLTEFIICFDLSKSSSKAITRWLKFAFPRHVQRLNLDFSAKADNSESPRGNYVFPKELLLTPSIDTTPPFNFKSLKSLSLKCVIVTNEAIEFFLHNCPLLEHLVIEETDKLSNLEVCGPSLVLKHLELRYLYDLKSIKISAPNLTSLTVPQLKRLLLEYVPKLVEVSANCGADSVKYFLPTFSNCIFQLEILQLQIEKPKVRHT